MRYAFSLFLILWLAVPHTAVAQNSVTDDDVNRVAKQLFCPTCQNTPVDVCPTQTCADWRALIRQQLAAGQTDQEILRYFADQYGAGVLANPPRSGFGWFVWLAPLLVVLVGMALFARSLRQWRTAAQPTTAASPTTLPFPTEEHRRRLEQEL